MNKIANVILAQLLKISQSSIPRMEVDGRKDKPFYEHHGSLEKALGKKESLG